MHINTRRPGSNDEGCGELFLLIDRASEKRVKRLNDIDDLCSNGLENTISAEYHVSAIWHNTPHYCQKWHQRWKENERNPRLKAKVFTRNHLAQQYLHAYTVSLGFAAIHK